MWAALQESEVTVEGSEREIAEGFGLGGGFRDDDLVCVEMGEGSFAAVDGVCLGRLVIFAGKILPNFVLAFHLTPIIIDQLVKCNEAIQECCRLSEPFGINRNEE